MSNFIDRRVHFHSIDDEGTLYLRVDTHEEDVEGPGDYTADVYTLEDFMKNVRAVNQALVKEKKAVRTSLLRRIRELEGDESDPQEQVPIQRSFIRFAGMTFLMESREDLTSPSSEQFRLSRVIEERAPYGERVEKALVREFVSQE